MHNMQQCTICNNMHSVWCRKYIIFVYYLCVFQSNANWRECKKIQRSRKAPRLFDIWSEVIKVIKMISVSLQAICTLFLISQAPITEHFVFSNYQCNANWWDTKVDRGRRQDFLIFFKHPRLKWLKLYPYLYTHSVQHHAKYFIGCCK